MRDHLHIISQQRPVRLVAFLLHRNSVLVAKHYQLWCCHLHCQLHPRAANTAGPNYSFHAHKWTNCACSSLSRSQSIAAVTGKMSEHSLSPLNGSASHASSLVHSATQAQHGAFTPPSSRQYSNVPVYSPTSTVSPLVNQQSTLTSPALALGRSLPSSNHSPPVPVATFRLPIRPVGPPPSQQLLSPVSGSGSGDGSLFQSLVQV